jgi:cytochrome b561
MHLTTSPVDWYAARAAGIAAYLLLTVVVTLGMTMASGRLLKRWPKFALEDVHRSRTLQSGNHFEWQTAVRAHA